MHKWRNLLGGLLLWAAHFFAVYIIGSVFPGKKIAAVLALVITLVILAVILTLAIKAFRAVSTMRGGLPRWMTHLSLLGYLIGGIAVIFQGLPAILLQ